MAGINSIEIIVVTAAAGAALLNACEPGFTSENEIPESPTRVLYCRPDLNPVDTASRACGTRPTTVFERIDGLRWQERRKGGRVSDPGFADYIEAILPDVKVEVPLPE